MLLSCLNLLSVHIRVVRVVMQLVNQGCMYSSRRSLKCPLHILSTIDSLRFFSGISREGLEESRKHSPFAEGFSLFPCWCHRFLTLSCQLCWSDSASGAVKQSQPLGIAAQEPVNSQHDCTPSTPSTLPLHTLHLALLCPPFNSYVVSCKGRE